MSTIRCVSMLLLALLRRRPETGRVELTLTTLSSLRLAILLPLPPSPTQVYKDFAPFYELKSPHHIKKTIRQDFQNSEENGRRLIAFHSLSSGDVEKPGPGGPFDGDWADILRKVSHLEGQKEDRIRLD